MLVVQVHAVQVPLQGGRGVGGVQEEGMRMWKEQLKWVLLWLTLSLLTCMHSAALILALHYNLIAMVSLCSWLRYSLLCLSPADVDV